MKRTNRRWDALATRGKRLRFSDDHPKNVCGQILQQFRQIEQIDLLSSEQKLPGPNIVSIMILVALPEQIRLTSLTVTAVVKEKASAELLIFR